MPQAFSRVLAAKAAKQTSLPVIFAHTSKGPDSITVGEFTTAGGKRIISNLMLKPFSPLGDGHMKRSSTKSLTVSFAEVKHDAKVIGSCKNCGAIHSTSAPVAKLLKNGEQVHCVVCDAAFPVAIASEENPLKKAPPRTDGKGSQNQPVASKSKAQAGDVVNDNVESGPDAGGNPDEGELQDETDFDKREGASVKAEDEAASDEDEEEEDEMGEEASASTEEAEGDWDANTNPNDAETDLDKRENSETAVKVGSVNEDEGAPVPTEYDHGVPDKKDKPRLKHGADEAAAKGKKVKAGSDSNPEDGEPLIDIDVDTGAKSDNGEMTVSLLKRVDLADTTDIQLCEVAGSPDKSYFLMLNRFPVARLSQVKASEATSKIFSNAEQLEQALIAAASKAGFTKEVRADFGFEELVVKVKRTEAVAQAIADKQAELSESYTAKEAALAKRYSQSFQLAFMGAMKGVYDNDIRAALVAKLDRVGIRQPQKLIDQVFKDVGTTFTKSVFARTEELLGKSDVQRNEVAAFLKEISYQVIGSTESSASEELADALGTTHEPSDVVDLQPQKVAASAAPARSGLTKADFDKYFK